MDGITEMGFSADVALQALQYTGGDVQSAITLLLENDGAVPGAEAPGEEEEEEEEEALEDDENQDDVGADGPGGLVQEDDNTSTEDEDPDERLAAELAGPPGEPSFQFTFAPPEPVPASGGFGGGFAAAAAAAAAAAGGGGFDGGAGGLSRGAFGQDAVHLGPGPAEQLSMSTTPPDGSLPFGRQPPPSQMQFGGGASPFGGAAAALGFGPAVGGARGAPGGAGGGLFGTASPSPFGGPPSSGGYRASPKVAAKRAPEATKKVDPAEAARVLAEIKRVLRGEPICKPDPKAAGNPFFLCGDSLQLREGGLGLARSVGALPERCWAVTGPVNGGYAEVLIESIGDCLVRAADPEGGGGRSAEAFLSPYNEFGSQRRRRTENTMRVGCSTDVGSFDPKSAFPENSGSSERTTFIWEGRHLKRNGEPVGQSLPGGLDGLQVGDRIGVLVDSHSVSFYVNGVQQGSPEAMPPRARGKQYHLVVDLRGSVLSLRSTTATQPITQMQLETGTLSGMVKADVAMTVEALQAAVEKADAAELSEPDATGRLPLHYLCANQRNSPELLRVLAAASPAALLHQDCTGCTPVACLFAGLQQGSAQQMLKAAELTSQQMKQARDAKFWGGQLAEPGPRHQGQPMQQEGLPKHLTQAPKFSVEHIAALCESNEQALWCTGKAGELPIISAERAGADSALMEWLWQKYNASGYIWIGGPETESSAAGNESCGMHLLLHMNMEREVVEGNKTLPTHQHQWDLAASLTEIAKGNRSFRNKTRIHGLPFAPEAVQRVCTSQSHCAFLLKTGVVWRLNVGILAASDSSGATKVSAEAAVYQVAKEKLEQLQGQLTGLEKALKKAEGANHKYNEADADAIAEMLQKPREDVVRVLRRLSCSASRKQEMACQILMELPPDDGQPYYDGDDVERTKFEISQVEKSIRKAADDVSTLEPAKDADAKIEAETLLHACDLQKWNDAPTDFQNLAICESEILALGTDGALYRWRNSSAPGTQELHPRAAELCGGEKIAAVEASSLRISVLTTSGKVASWLDDVCRASPCAEPAAESDSKPEPGNVAESKPAAEPTLVQLLEHSAKSFEFDSEIDQIAVTDCGTAAVTRKGSVYWWGGRPWLLRQNRFKAMQQSHANDFEDGYNTFVDSLRLSLDETEEALYDPSSTSVRARTAGGGGRAVEMRGGFDQGYRDRPGGKGGGGRGGSRGGYWPGPAKPSHSFQTRAGGPYGGGRGVPVDVQGHQFAVVSGSAEAALAAQVRALHRNERHNVPSLKEVMSMIGDDSYYRTHLKSLGGERSSSAKAFSAMHKAFSENVRSLKTGSAVLLQSDKSPLKYKAGARVLRTNGKITSGCLKEDIDDISDPGRTVQVLIASRTESTRLNDLVLLDAESRWTEAILLKVDRERGVGLVREVGKPAEDVTIVNLMQLTPNTELYAMYDSVLEKPIQVFDAQQLLSDETGHNGVTFNEAYDRYRSSCGDRKVLERQKIIEILTQEGSDKILTEEQLAIFRNVVCRPDITDIQGSGWCLNMTLRDVTNAEILYRWEADLSTGKWKLSPSRWATGGLTHSRLCMAGHAAAVEIDSQSYLCEPAVPSLPTVACAAGAAALIPYTPALPKFESANRWEKQVDGHWTPFSKTESKRLHDSRNSGQDLCNVGHYIVYFGPMLAQDQESGDQINVRPTKTSSGPAASTTGSLVLLGFNPIEVGNSAAIGCMGRTSLHDAILLSSTAVAALLERVNPAEFEQMATHRDNTGATAFFAAMRCADVISAFAIFTKSLGFVERACHPADIFGCPPIHALFGLSQMESDVIRREPCTDEVLSTLLQELAKDHLLVRARDFAGNTALEALVLSTSQEGGSVPCWPALLKAFVAAPINGIEICIAGAEDSKLDGFVCSLASCSQLHPFAKELPQWVGNWAYRAHALDLSRSMKMSAKALMRSLVRVFCALFSSGDAVDDKHGADVFYTEIFRAVPGLAMEVLAKTANDVIEVVRLGLPLRPLPVGGIVPSSVGTRLSASKGTDAGEVLSTKREYSAKADGAGSTGQPPISVQPAGNRRDEPGLLASGGANQRLMTEGATVQLRPSLRPSHRQNVPDGSIGTVLVVEAEQGIATVEFATGEATSSTRLPFDEEDDTEEDVDDDDDDHSDEYDIAQIIARATAEGRAPGGGRRAAMTWRGKLSNLVLAGASEAAAKAASDPKTQRARIFHLCVQTIAMLYDENAAKTQAGGGCPFDGALVAAARILQPSWEHIFDCCDISEAGLCEAEYQRSEGRQMAVTQYMYSAYGVGCGAPDAAQYAYVAVMLDAVVWLKQVVPDYLTRTKNERVDELQFVVSAAAPRDAADTCDELVRGVSFAYQHGQDPWSQQKRRNLLKMSLDIDVEAALSTEYDGKRIPRYRDPHRDPYRRPCLGSRGIETSIETRIGAHALRFLLLPQSALRTESMFFAPFCQGSSTAAPGVPDSACPVPMAEDYRFFWSEL